jgi:hypothetical protein
VNHLRKRNGGNKKTGIFKDLTGQVFNKLTVINYDKNDGKWRCKCECGNYHNVTSSALKSGSTKSCGCWGVDSRYKHHLTGTRIYRIYSGMKSRCYNKNNHAYSWYGGRGIYVCKEWLSDPFCFYEWAISNGYGKNLSIDRVDNNREYSPSNCKWSTEKEQGENRRSNRYITINGETKLSLEWSKIFGINQSAICKRMNRGWDEVSAVIMPLRKGGKRTTEDEFNKQKLLFTRSQ